MRFMGYSAGTDSELADDTTTLPASMGMRYYGRDEGQSPSMLPSLLVTLADANKYLSTINNTHVANQRIEIFEPVISNGMVGSASWHQALGQALTCFSIIAS
eukprot:scaffold224149_cov45-Prasinocladus_malaysianus.AAC.1